MMILFEACESVGLLRTILFLKILLKIICTIAPILLTITLTIDFGKSVVSGNSDNVKQNLKTSVRRIIACLIIFFVPTILNYTFDLVGKTNVSYTKCLTNANLDTINQLEEEQKLSSKKENDDKAYGTGNTGDNSKKEKKSDSNDSKNTSNSNSGGSDTKKENNQYNYKFEKDLIVLAHYHGNKVSKKTIVILNGKGEKVSNKKFTFSISKPLATISEGGKMEAVFSGSATVTATLKKDPSYSIKFKVHVLRGTYTKVRTTRAIKTYDLKTNKNTTIPKGTDGVYNGASIVLSSSYKQKVYYHGDTLKVGDSYYPVDYQDVKSYQYSVAKPFSQDVAEEFINSNGFSSSTKYLFWVSVGTQTDYLFKYSKGKWHLYKTFDINTGDALGLNPGSNGGNCNGSVHNAVFASGLGACNSITSSAMDSFYMDKHFTGHWLSVSYAVHIRHEGKGSWGGTFHEGFSTPKVPKSHGCVRHTSDTMKWIRDNMKRFGGSRVVFF